MVKTPTADKRKHQRYLTVFLGNVCSELDGEERQQWLEYSYDFLFTFKTLMKKLESTVNNPRIMATTLGITILKMLG